MSLYTILDKIKNAVKNSSSSQWSIGSFVHDSFAMVVSDDNGITEIAAYNIDNCETNSAETIQLHNHADDLIAIVEASIKVVEDWIHAGRPALNGNIGLIRMRALEAALEKLK